MKRKLNSYLASGLLKKSPGLPENLSVPQSSDSNILQQCDVSSYENKLLSDLRPSLKSKEGECSKCDGSSGDNQLLSDLQASIKSKQRKRTKYKQGASSKSKQGTSSKSKQGFIDLCENTDTSEGESSELICTERPDPDSGEASKRIRDRLNWRKRARKKLVFLSSPVELKVSAVAESERHLQESKVTSPEVNIVSPPAVLQGFSPEVPSVCEKIVEPPLADFNQSKNVCSSLETSSDPCTLEQHLANVSDLLDMSYIDGLMIIPPAGCPYDGDFI